MRVLLKSWTSGGACGFRFLQTSTSVFLIWVWTTHHKCTLMTEWRKYSDLGVKTIGSFTEVLKVFASSIAAEKIHQKSSGKLNSNKRLKLLIVQLTSTSHVGCGPTQEMERSCCNAQTSRSVLFVNASVQLTYPPVQMAYLYGKNFLLECVQSVGNSEPPSLKDAFSPV